MTEAADAQSAATEVPDEILVRRALAGERNALDQLVRRHQADISRLLWRFARHHADLQDLVQETFLRMVRGLPTLRLEAPFIHWLRHVAVNVGRDYYRREKVRQRWTVDPLAAAPEDTPPESVDPAPDPAARLAANEIKDLLAQLSPDDRTLLTLHYLEGWEFARIGQALGWSTPVTKLRAFRARRRARELFRTLDSHEKPASP